MYDLQESVTTRGDEAYATMIDFEKAYDRVNWEYLWATLRHFGFGQRFIQFVRLMYTNSEFQLTVNGNLIEPIRPSRGVKQGTRSCPCSLFSPWNLSVAQSDSVWISVPSCQGCLWRLECTLRMMPHFCPTH